MIVVEIDFIEIALTVFLTVFFQSLFTHMVMVRGIMRDINKKGFLLHATEKNKNSDKKTRCSDETK